MTTLLTEIELHMRATKVPATRFGLLAVGDKRLILDLECGRRPGPQLVARVRAYMANAPQPYTGRGPDWWHPERDDRLWGLLIAGTPHSQAAAAMGTTLSAVQNRARHLAKLRLPAKRSRAHITAAVDGYAATRAPALLRQIDAHLVDTGMCPIRFGSEAASYPDLVRSLREGADVPRKLKQRARVYLAKRGAADAR